MRYQSIYTGVSWIELSEFSKGLGVTSDTLYEHVKGMKTGEFVRFWSDLFDLKTVEVYDNGANLFFSIPKTAKRITVSRHREDPNILVTNMALVYNNRVYDFDYAMGFMEFDRIRSPGKKSAQEEVFEIDFISSPPSMNLHDESE